MRNMHSLVAALAVLAASSFVSAADVPQVLPLVPEPVVLAPAVGTFAITPETQISADAAFTPVAHYFADLLAPALGKAPAVIAHASSAPAIIMTLDKTLPPEGYTLDITHNGVAIRASAPAGAFYACQTLRQLLPPTIESPDKTETAWTLPCCHIEDHPRYPWRGILLDCSRHFFPKAYILRYIDLLALHKMNVLHWHLTDDQGWRIEIKKYPKLMSVSAWRAREEPDPSFKTPEPIVQPPTSTPPGEQPYGGYYTQDDIREVVAYAQTHFVTVVPEIEMPGHSLAVLAAYPELSCTGQPFQVGTRWGTYKDVYSPANEQTFTFLQGVLDEVCTLFPSQYIHIGGDEVPKDRWQASPECQALIKRLGLKDEAELQSYFVKRMGDYLVNVKHRQFIGWNEILEGGLAPGAIVESWQGTKGGIAAAEADHDVIMSPGTHCYFDHPYEPTVSGKSAGALPLDKVFAFDPIAHGMTPEEAKHVLGGEGTVWSERIPTPARADYMTYPRACALAEVLWTAAPAAQRDFSAFAARLRGHFKELDALHVAYYNDPVAHSALVGKWTPATVAKTTTQLTFDITGQLTKPGAYAIRFDFLDGAKRLNIQSVTISADDRQLAADNHPGFAGGSSENTLYTLTMDPLPAPDFHGKILLHASVNASTGTDTTGDILLLPPSDTAANK